MMRTPSPYGAEVAVESPSDRAPLGVEVDLFCALGLIEAAVTSIDRLQTWKEAVEPQAIRLIDQIKTEQAKWEAERSVLFKTLADHENQIAMLKRSLEVALFEKHVALQLCFDMRSRSNLIEQQPSSHGENTLIRHDDHTDLIATAGSHLYIE
ncbi:MULTISPECIES: hypothetical protein [unclassified Methylobacterium]|uniref:hypothetical protein n=1 Tax=unclassified Methylobacterium TaxID=2615210 RepID=UPI0012E3E5F4|nr:MULTISPECIES: hypothetical protein [unclassified Methylobacterium]